MFALDVVQVGGRIGPQRQAIAQQKVEGPMGRDLRRQLAQGQGQLGDAGHASVRLGQLLHDPAEGALAVGVAHGPEAAVQARRKVFQVAVVGKHPVTAPELAHKRVAVLQRHTALGGLADVGNDVAAFDRVAAYQLGHGRGAGWLVIDKTAQTLVTAITTIFKKSDPPTVGVLAGVAAALREAAAAGGACVLEWAISTGLRDGVAASR